MEDVFNIADKQRFEKGHVYVVSYSSLSNGRLYSEVRVFKTKKSASACMESYISSELDDTDTYFGSMLADNYGHDRNAMERGGNLSVGVNDVTMVDESIGITTYIKLIHTYISE